MKILFCWPTISGYMAACWRELAGRADADVFVLAFPRSAGKYSPFATDLMHGIPSRLLDEQVSAEYTPSPENDGSESTPRGAS